MPTNQEDAGEHGQRLGRWLNLWTGFKHSIATEDVKGRIYKVTRWLLFGVLIGLLPFAFPFVNIFASEANPDVIRWVQIRNTLFGRGDLLLIAATLVAASAGDLIGSGREREGRKIVAGFSFFVIFIICVVWYGIVADKIEAHAVYNTSGTASVSLWLFSFSVLCSAGCLLLGEKAKRDSEAKQGEEQNE